MFVLKDAGAELTIEALGDEIASLAAQMSAAMCRWLMLVAEFDRRCGWGTMGCASCAHWVSWRCGVAPATAREHVRVAQRLRELPLIREAFARGELSYSKVRALTRVEGIADEASLLDLAQQANAAQLERVLSAARGVTSREADVAYVSRTLDLFIDHDGTLVVSGRLPAEMGAVLLEAVRRAEGRLRERADGPPATDAEELGAEPVIGVPRPAAGARRADALLWLVEQAVAGGAEEAGAGSSTSCEVVVHVDAATLSGEQGPDERPVVGAVAVVEDGPPVAPETIRRLCCDAGIRPAVVGADGEVLDVGRRTRAIPPAIRRALRIRDEGCRFPGCDRTRWLQAHHVEHWAHGGATRLSNLVMLCHHHHQLVHEGGFTLALDDDGAVAVRTPQGRTLPAWEPVTATPDPDRFPVPATPAGARTAPALPPPGRPYDAGTEPGPLSLFPRGAGTPWDLGMAVDAVLGMMDGPSGLS